MTKWRLTGTLLILRAFTNVRLTSRLGMLTDGGEGSEIQLRPFPIVATVEDTSIPALGPQRPLVARCAHILIKHVLDQCRLQRVKREDNE